jgi:hypothetical protein
LSTTSNDDPTELARTATGMAKLLEGKNAITAPWWCVGASVEALIKLAAEDGPLQEPATLAVQVMASVYNETITGGKRKK